MLEREKSAIAFMMAWEMNLPKHDALFSASEYTETVARFLGVPVRHIQMAIAFEPSAGLTWMLKIDKKNRSMDGPNRAVNVSSGLYKALQRRYVEPEYWESYPV